jgi:hypothetical protein
LTPNDLFLVVLSPRRVEVVENERRMRHAAM